MTENESLKIMLAYKLGRGCKPHYSDEEIEKAFDTAISALQEIRRYREIGTVEECREAVENQKAKNPSVHKQQYSDAYNCSKCGWTFIHKNETGWFCGQHYKFCPNCGQAIRWNENLEGMEDE